jgi:hypothetical protein
MTLLPTPSSIQLLSSPRAATSRVACSGWRSRLVANVTFGSLGFGLTDTGFIAMTTNATNHRTHKPYHHRPKEKHL